ncbi:S26 family signal peptidase, partial [Bacteroides fragilis]|uniref:S26 family signal peptidase n=1 Tax=Bacteroides fragilis TaxID=817 RepID=UPI0005CE8832
FFIDKRLDTDTADCLCLVQHILIEHSLLLVLWLCIDVDAEDTLYIEGRPSQHCYFTKDYYWMASNNSVNLSDSRLFGFVPQDHVIGKASRIWFSKTDHTGIFSGYRWERFFQPVK